MHELLIIGGGASGLFLGANLKQKGILILEKNPQIAAKIKISGGAKCNLTNRYINAKNYISTSKFKPNLLMSYKDLLEYFLNFGVCFKELKNNQFFAQSSEQIINVLKNETKHCQIITNCEVINAKKENDIFIVNSNLGKLKSKKLVIASGGLSYPRLGATDIGIQIAKHFGISYTKLSPALVGLSVQKDEFWFKNLSGVSLNVNLTYENHKFSGDLLFTHKGISGPVVLNASLFWEKGRMAIDFLPNFKLNFNNSNKQLSSLLPLPKSFIKQFLLSLNLADKQPQKYSQNEKEQILKLKNYIFAPAGNFGYQKAEVTKGGICLNELDENLQSKKVKNLFFIGEVLDITGMLGGYNLHLAMSLALRVANFLSLQKTT